MFFLKGALFHFIFMKSSSGRIPPKNPRDPGFHLKLTALYDLYFLQVFFQYFCNLNPLVFRSQALRVISNLQDSTRDSIKKLFEDTKKDFAHLISKIPFFKKKDRPNSRIISKRHITHVNFILYFHPHYEMIPEANLDPGRLRLLDTLTQDFINFVNDYCEPNVLYYYPYLFPLNEMPPLNLDQQMEATLIETNTIDLNYQQIYPMAEIPNDKQTQEKDGNYLSLYEAFGELPGNDQEDSFF